MCSQLKEPNFGKYAGQPLSRPLGPRGPVGQTPAQPSQASQPAMTPARKARASKAAKVPTSDVVESVQDKQPDAPTSLDVDSAVAAAATDPVVEASSASEAAPSPLKKLTISAIL